MIIDHFDSLKQFCTFKLLNKKFREIIKYKSHAVLRYSGLKKYFSNYEEIDWKKLLKMKTDQCSLCKKMFEDKEYLKFCEKRVESSKIIGLYFSVKVPYQILCSNCEPEEGNNPILKVKYLIVSNEESVSDIRVMITLLNTDKYLVKIKKWS